MRYGSPFVLGSCQGNVISNKPTKKTQSLTTHFFLRMAAGHSIRESHIYIKISPSEAWEAEYVPSVAFLWNLLFSLPLLMQHGAVICLPVHRR